jgi:hypothetical protein
VQAVALQDPLRSRPDVAAEPPLQLARGEAELGGDVRDAGARGRREHPGDHLLDPACDGIGGGAAGAEEGLDGRDLPPRRRQAETSRSRASPASPNEVGPADAPVASSAIEVGTKAANARA